MECKVAQVPAIHVMPFASTLQAVAQEHTLGAGDLERLRPGLLRGGVLRLCLSLGGDDRRLGGDRGKRPLGDIGLQTITCSETHVLPMT